MSLRNYFMNTAQEAAKSAEQRIAYLDAELAEVEKQKANIDEKRAAARIAFERLANYPVTRGTDYLCPLCWVEDGKDSLLRPVPSHDRNDIFRCRVCHYEAVIPG